MDERTEEKQSQSPWMFVWLVLWLWLVTKWGCIGLGRTYDDKARV